MTPEDCNYTTNGYRCRLNAGHPGGDHPMMPTCNEKGCHEDYVGSGDDGFVRWCRKHGPKGPKPTTQQITMDEIAKTPSGFVRMGRPVGKLIAVAMILAAFSVACGVLGAVAVRTFEIVYAWVK